MSLRFTVINPVEAQDCARVNLSMMGMDMASIKLENLDTRVCSTDLTGQGQCQAGAFPRVPSTLQGGGCPLKVVDPKMLFALIGQSTAAPCSINTISVGLAFNVPMVCSGCAGSGPVVTISGLNGTATLSDGAMPLQIYGQPLSTAVWDQAGSLSLDLSLLHPDVGRGACEVCLRCLPPLSLPFFPDHYPERD